MPATHVALTASVTFRYQLATQIAENVLCYRVLAAPITAAKINTLANFMASTGWAQIRNVIPTGAYLLDVTAKSLDAGLAYEILGTITGSALGTRNGDPMYNVTSPVNWKSSTPTRSGRGRTSFGPTVEGDVAGETIGSTLLGLLTNLGAYLIVTHPGAEWEIAVGSRKLGISYGITGATIKALIGSMRSRLTRR